MPQIISTRDVENMLLKRVKERVNQIAAEEKDRASKNIQRRINHEIDNIALSIMQHYEIETMHDKLIIAVRKLEDPTDVSRT